MSNMDLLSGLALVLGWVFFVPPILMSTVNSSAGYIESVINGLMVTAFMVLMVIILTSIIMSIVYFSGDLKPNTPLTDFIEWVNSI